MSQLPPRHPFNDDVLWAIRAAERGCPPVLAALQNSIRRHQGPHEPGAAATSCRSKETFMSRTQHRQKSCSSSPSRSELPPAIRSEFSVPTSENPSPPTTRSRVSQPTGQIPRFMLPILSLDCGIRNHIRAINGVLSGFQARRWRSDRCRGAAAGLRACRSGWSSDFGGRAAPGRFAGRHRGRANGWRSCAEGCVGWPPLSRPVVARWSRGAGQRSAW